MQSFHAFGYLWQKGGILSPAMDMDTGQLVRRAKAGDRAAMAGLYEAHYDMARGVCQRIVRGDGHLAADLAHDAFVLAFRSLDALRDERRFGEWMGTIARNVALRYVERRGRLPMLPLSALPEDEVAGTEQADRLLQESEVLRAVDALPEGYARVFRLAVMEGYSHKEIAEMLGIEPHSSSSQLARAKAMLRRMLGRRTLAIMVLALLVAPLYRYLAERRGTPVRHPLLSSTRPAVQEHGGNGPAALPDTTVPPQPQPSPVPPQPSSLPSVPQDTIPQHPLPSPAEDAPVPVEPLLAESDTLRPDTLRPVEMPARPDLTHQVAGKRRGQWQLLASGTLASSISQNVPGSIPGISSVPPAPDGPGHDDPTRFTTWEQFFEHLNNVPPEDMTSAQQPLLNIAANNRGPIEERERHERPLTFGFSLRHTLVGRWGVETGLQYSLLKSDFTQGTGSYYIRRQQRAHYLGVPLHMTCCLATTRSLQAYVTVGVQVNIPLHGTQDTRYVMGSQVSNGGRATFLPPLQWQMGVGAGLQYSLSPHWAVYAEPAWQWYVPSGSQVHTVWTEHPFSFSLPMGLRYSW